MNRKHILCLFLFLVTSFSASAQVYNPNIDFEMGSPAYWHFYTGSCCPISTPAVTPPLPTRHELTSGTGVDPYGLFPVVSPDGGSYSLKLGNDSVNSQAEKARYYIHVPAGVTDYSLIYRYAVVFEDPGHSPSMQPRFEVRAYDSITNNPIPCAQFTYVADSNLPGFHKSALSYDVYYKPWSSGSINLSGLAGSTIIMDFATADCGLGAHFGYGYIDMSSGLFAIATTKCDTDSITLTAPAGFNTYTWYDSSTGILMYSSQVVRIHNPSVPITFKVIMAPFPGYGCPDTLFSKVIPSHLHVQPGYDTTLCAGDTITLTVSATDSVPIRYLWSPAAGVGCDSCSTTTVFLSPPARYIVTVSNILGCSKTDTFNVRSSIDLTPLNDISLCKGDSAVVSASATSASPPITYLWSPAAGLSCTTCPNPVINPSVSASYILAIKDNAGCILKDTIKVFRDDLSGVPAKNILLCRGQDQYLHADATGSAGPFSYSWAPSTGLSCTACPGPLAGTLTTTAYNISVTDTNGCTIKDTLTVYVNYITISLPHDTAVCNSAAVTLSGIANANAGPLTYIWGPPQGLSCSDCLSPLASPAATTVYSIMATDTSGCTARAFITLGIDNLSLSPMRDTVICLGFPLQLSPTVTGNNNSLQYLWYPAHGLSCTTCPNPEAYAPQNTTYHYTVTDTSGCSVSDSVQINIDPCDLHFPNAFTPNDDGLNDIIRVVGHLEHISDFAMGLYNRWGQRVYYTNDIYSGWNGVFNGRQADLGTYFYMITYRIYTKKYMLKGDFELIR